MNERFPRLIYPCAKVMALFSLDMEINGLSYVLWKYKTSGINCNILTRFLVNLICLGLPRVCIMVNNHTWGPGFLMASSHHILQIFEYNTYLAAINKRFSRLMMNINSRKLACDVLPFIVLCCVKPINDLGLWIHTNYVSGHNLPWVCNDTNIWILGWQQEIGRTGKNVMTYLAVWGFAPPRTKTVLSTNA